jgi:hypothetical protein
MLTLKQLILATTIAIYGGPSAAAFEIVGGNETSSAQLMEIAHELESWLDANSPYPRADLLLKKIAFVAPEAVVNYHGQATQLDEFTRGLYDEEAATIYLVEPWDARDAFDRSVLLHELAHHRQAEAKHWYCDHAQEWDAYRLQAAFLEDEDIDYQFNWALIVLESSCAKRDVHP